MVSLRAVGIDYQISIHRLSTNLSYKKNQLPFMKLNILRTYPILEMNFYLLIVFMSGDFDHHNGLLHNITKALLSKQALPD
jgi:hypothetical protein